MKKAALIIQSLFYVLAGLNHFRSPGTYLGMIPPYLPIPETLNIIAGTAEILLGIGLMFPQYRKWASYGIILMLFAFIPAHIYFIHIGSCIPGGLCVPNWVGWLRLIAIHPLLMAWAWWCRK